MTLFGDKGWRICEPDVSGKRTVFQGESRPIKPNPGENELRMGWRVSLGQEVGEYCRIVIRPVLPHSRPTAESNQIQPNPTKSNQIKPSSSESVS